mgnify:CR=1 FL=1
MSFFYIENKHIINSSNNEIINVEYYFFEVIIDNLSLLNSEISNASFII